MVFMKQIAHRLCAVSKFLVFIHVTFYVFYADGTQIIKVGRVFELYASCYLSSSPNKADALRFNICGNFSHLYPSLILPGL